MADATLCDAGGLHASGSALSRAWTSRRRWFSLVLSLAAILVALIIGGIVIGAAGGDPIRSYLHIAKASFGSLGVLSDTIVKATPILLAALACSVAFRMRLWNIGAEGQFIMGAFGASAIILAPVLPAETSRWIFIPVMILAGMAAGAAWGFIPGYLKAAFNVNEIISSLMLNYIAVAWVNFWIFAVWTEGGFQMSPTFPKTAWLPRLSGLRRERAGLLRTDDPPGSCCWGSWQRSFCGS